MHYDIAKKFAIIASTGGILIVAGRASIHIPLLRLCQMIGINFSRIYRSYWNSNVTQFKKEKTILFFLRERTVGMTDFVRRNQQVLGLEILAQLTTILPSFT